MVRGHLSPAPARFELNPPAQLHESLCGGKHWEVSSALGLGRGWGFGLAESEQLLAGWWQLCVEETCRLASATGFFLLS